MASVSKARPHCVNQMGKTHSKPLAARHGRGTPRARHAVCESAFSVQAMQTKYLLQYNHFIIIPIIVAQ